MLPLQIRLKGIYSYVNEQTIDFTQLTQNRLFGIFGAVGSGKSTILEAMTLALYDRIERLGKAKRNYNLMNLKSNELLIEFDFIGGRAQKKYRFRVQAKRNSRKFSDVKKLDRKAYEWNEEENNWLPIKKTAEEILELSYENFRRTIIIPQGKFQEFLQLKQTDRANMLEEIFQLNRFNLWDNASALEKKYQTQLNQIEGALQPLNELQDNQLLDQYQWHYSLQEALDKDTTTYAQLDKNLQEQEKTKKGFEQLTQLQEEEKTLKDRKKPIDDLEKNLQKYIFCQSNFNALLQQINSSESEINALQNALQKNEETLKNLQENQKSFQKEIKTLQKKYKNPEQITVQLNDLKSIIKIQKTQDDLQKKSQDLTTKKTELENIEKEEQGLNENIKKTETNLEKLRNQQGNAQELIQKSLWFQKHKNIQEEEKKLAEELSSLEKKLKKASKEKKEIYQESDLAEFIEQDLTNLKVRAILEIIENKEYQLKIEKEKLNQQIIDIEANIKLLEHAQKLKTEEPCPLCGSLHHPTPFSDKAILKSQQQIKVKETALNHKIETSEKAIKDFNNLIQSYKGSVDKHQELKTQIIENKKNLKTHLGNFIWGTYNEETEQKFNQQQSQSQELVKTIKSQEKAIKKLRLDKEALQKKLEKTRKDFQEIEKLHQKYTTESNLLKENLQTLKWQDFETQSVQNLEEEQKNMLDASNQLANLQEELSQIEEKITVSQTKISTQKESLKKEEKGHKKNLKELTQKIKKSDFENTEEIQTILALNLDTSKDQQTIDTFKKDFNRNQTLITELRKNLKDLTYQPEAHVKLTIQLNELKQKIKIQQQDIGSADQRIKALTKKLEDKEKLSQDYDDIQIKVANIGIIKNLFKGKGFINYVSTLKLKNLCDAANARFKKLTRNQLELIINEDNQFEVRDYLNGGEIRSIKTLSGGQTFQASLSLAIALADIVNQHKGEKTDFFFIDEGFGSLDKNALASVFETLQSLRNENKIIGIISHVEDLQDEISTFLKITNTENGSQIHKSWDI